MPSTDSRNAGELNRSPPPGSPAPSTVRDEPRQVVVGAGPRVVLVGQKPVGLVARVGGEVPAAVVAAVGCDPPLEGRTAEAPAGRLVQVPLVVVAEMVLQEALVDLLDDREQPHIGRVQPQLGVGVP